MEKKLNIHVEALEKMTTELMEHLYLLSKKPGEIIEVKFYGEVILPLKEILAYATNVHFEIFKRTEVTSHLDQKAS